MNRRAFSSKLHTSLQPQITPASSADHTPNSDRRVDGEPNEGIARLGSWRLPPIRCIAEGYLERFVGMSLKAVTCKNRLIADSHKKADSPLQVESAMLDLSRANVEHLIDHVGKLTDTYMPLRAWLSWPRK